MQSKPSTNFSLPPASVADRLHPYPCDLVLQQLHSIMSEQWALITGCSEGGIGDGLARSLHAKGIKVIASARNVSKINSAFAAKPGVETLALDVNDQKSIDAAVEKGECLSLSILQSAEG